MPLESAVWASPGSSSARQRILDTAYGLFSRHGLRAVGIDRIIDESGVARKTFYRHFPSKADLILAFLDLRGQRWTHWLATEMRRLGETPRERILAIFDVFDEWFRSEDFESCALIAAAFENRHPDDPIHQRAVRQLEAIRQLIQNEIPRQGRAGDREALAYRIQILMMGATVSATRGDLAAARRTREMAELVLDRYQLQ